MQTRVQSRLDFLTKIDFPANVSKSKVALFSLPYVIVVAGYISKIVFSRQYLLDHKLFYFLALRNCF